MNSFLPKHFYLFKGDWYERFIELLELTEKERFIIWEPLNKNKKHNLIIVIGASLPESYCFNKNIWKTDERVFNAFYKDQVNKFNLHTNFNSKIA